MRLAFADSEVAGVVASGPDLHIRFSAASLDPSFRGEEAGYLLGLVLELRSATWTGDLSTCFGRLREGVLSDAVTRFVRLDLPFDGPGPWRAEFAFANGTLLQAEAAHATVALGRGERFQASLAC